MLDNGHDSGSKVGCPVHSLANHVTIYCGWHGWPQKEHFPKYHTGGVRHLEKVSKDDQKDVLLPAW